MCGLAGLYRRSFNPESDFAAVKSMLPFLINRGPDGEGLAREGRATFGHRRLKIIDLSDAARQPMLSRCGRYLLVYNGEVYNYQALRAELGLDKASLRSTSDTEILLEAWARWGERCLPKIVGQFAFAIYDRDEQRLWLARDRFGEKPLFYHQTPDGDLTFASNLSALMAAPNVPRELDRSALLEYVTLRYVVAPRTLIKDVRKLNPGALLCLDDTGLKVRQWYEPRFHQSMPNLNQDELTERFGDLLEQASARCLVADVPTGLLLSDGIDSNAIRASLSALAPQLPCFTYGYQSNDQSLTLHNTGGKTKAFAFTVRERLDAMRPAFSGLNEPVGDGASLATWLLLRQARSDAKVFLCGHGSDEVLGGYRLNQDRLRLRVLRFLAYMPLAMSKQPLDRYLYGRQELGQRVETFRAATRSSAPAAARYLIHRPLPLCDIAELYRTSQAPADYLTSVETLYANCRPEAPDLDRMQEVMIHTFLSENILSFADAVAMDSSVELRMPFLDRDLVAFAMTLPAKARVGFWPKGPHTKRILRWWGQRHMDAAVVTRRKRSFDFGSLRPLLASHGDELRAFVLESNALRTALPGLETWLSHAPEYFRGCWQGTLWALLALGIWAEANHVTA